MTDAIDFDPEVYQGQFGEYKITDEDRKEVKIYRGSLIAASLFFAIAATLALWNGSDPLVQQSLTWLYWGFCLSLGVSLVTIHIYMVSLHRMLQLFLIIGTVASIVFAVQSGEPLAVTVYNTPLSLLGVGFTFATTVGIYFKEAFCFDRPETKFLTPTVPLLLIGHMAGFLPLLGEKILLAVWAIGFVIFGLSKLQQPIPIDIGDKSVFEYLRLQRQQSAQA